MAEYETLDWSVEEHVLTLALDRPEGIAAFREKRSPGFTGRACDLPFHPWED